MGERGYGGSLKWPEFTKKKKLSLEAYMETRGRNEYNEKCMTSYMSEQLAHFWQERYFISMVAAASTTFEGNLKFHFFQIKLLSTALR